MKRPGILFLALVWVVSIGWFLFHRIKEPDRLVAEALRGEIAGSERGLERNHSVLIRKACDAIEALGSEDTSSRKGLVRLLCGVRMSQLADRYGVVSHPHLRRTLTPSDPEITQALVRLYREEVRFAETVSDDTRYERLLGMAMAVGGADFLTIEEFTRHCWEQSPPVARPPLLSNLSDLILTARTPEKTARQIDSGWYGVHVTEREKGQEKMMGVLNQWAIPMIRRAVEGEELLKKDLPMVRYMVEALELLPD